MNLIIFAKFVVACISGHISITSYDSYILHLSHFVIHGSFAEHLIDAYRDVRACLGLQGFEVVSRPYFRIF